MSRDFQEEINQAEAQIQSVLTQMEQLKQEFIAAAVEFFRPWHWERTEAIAKTAPEQTKKLGVEKLKELKAEVRELQDATESTVANILNDNDLWWHIKRNHLRVEQYTDKLPDKIEVALRYIGGRLAPILQKYGYISDRYGGSGTGRAWNGLYQESGVNLSGVDYKLPFYPDKWVLSSQMKTPIMRYFVFQEQAKKHEENLGKLRREKAESEAESLWNDA